jgi:hypothetical protein
MSIKVTLENIYQIKCDYPSDINEHLPVLKEYAEDCEHITELGVRWVVSTYAFMMGKPKRLVSYDVLPIETWENTTTQELTELARENDIDFEFKLENVLETEIEETDLLFFDTIHTYKQVKSELELHANKARKYLVFHDTTMFEVIGEDEGLGIGFAIKEFLILHPEWVLDKEYRNNNGLTILKRKK